MKIVSNVRDSSKERLIEVAWMSESTRVETLKKMKSFTVKIGFPDVWKDYSSLQITDSIVNNLVAGRQYLFQYRLNYMNAPANRSR